MSPPPASSSTDDDAAPAVCPVDHKAREAWLQQAKLANASGQTPPPLPPHPVAAQTSQTQTQTPMQPLQSATCDSSTLDQTPSPSAATTTPTPTAKAPTASGILNSLRGTTSPATTTGALGTQREISTIPRASLTTPQTQTTRPANNERETAPDEKTGNWIYPSESMFFEAMKRKAYNPSQADMKTIVPIHNAVNERAWSEIKEWERGRGADACGGPRLASFSGLAQSMTPRARWRTFLGYKAPFDRHDWVVDRCGIKVEYVIDFYAGRDEGVRGKELNFFLDVRPKLNTWEGVKLRALRFVGL